MGSEAVNSTLTESPVFAEAERTMRRLARLESAIERVQKQAAEQRAEIDEWERSEVTTLDGIAVRLRLDLQGLAGPLLDQDPLHRRSVELPSGTLGFRAGRVSTIMTHEAATVAWLEEAQMHDLVRVKKEPRIDEIKKRFALRGTRYVVTDGLFAGEALPGIEASEPQDVFFAKPRPGALSARIPLPTGLDRDDLEWAVQATQEELHGGGSG